MSEIRYRCPCCGYYTLGKRGGYEICPVCFWEDDDDLEEFDVEAPERPRGPNSVHLWQARENFRAFGSAEERGKSFVRAPLSQELPENNAHQPKHRPVRTLAPDFRLKPPLAPPSLTEEQAMAMVRDQAPNWSLPLSADAARWSTAYGSLTYPRFQRVDDGMILEPCGTRDFWKVRIHGLPNALLRRDAEERHIWIQVDWLALIDDKAAELEFLAEVGPGMLE